MISSWQKRKPTKLSSRQKATKFSSKPAKSNASRQNAGNAGSAENPDIYMYNIVNDAVFQLVCGKEHSEDSFDSPVWVCVRGAHACTQNTHAHTVTSDTHTHQHPPTHTHTHVHAHTGTINLFCVYSCQWLYPYSH